MMRDDVCRFCKHYQGGKGLPEVCAAFPAGIPLEIQAGEDAHMLPRADDNGIQYEVSAKAKAQGFDMREYWESFDKPKERPPEP
jgi:hypothetical protein